jgi:ElaB/YqjD/DUF883 family membrane-anchored ribosome-binding protein
MTQPEALRLADELQRSFPKSGKEAAAELRRLHESNQELLAALKEMLDGENKSFRELCEQARAAIAKGEAK